MELYFLWLGKVQDDSGLGWKENISAEAEKNDFFFLTLQMVIKASEFTHKALQLWTLCTELSHLQEQ